MIRLIKILLILILLSQQKGFAQVSDYSFIWLNKAQSKLAGNLIISLQENSEKSEFVLSMKVKWLNENGNEIEAIDQKPLLYLSESDIHLSNPTGVFCKTFTDSDQFDIYFKEKGELVFGYLDNLNEVIEIRFHLKYAFSEKDIYDAKTYNLEYPGGRQLVYRVPSSSLYKKPVIQTAVENQIDPVTLEVCNRIDSCFQSIQTATVDLLRDLSERNFQQQITRFDNLISLTALSDTSTVSDIRKDLNSQLDESSGLLDQIDNLSIQLRHVDSLMLTPLSPDSLLKYQRLSETINRRISGAKNDILQVRSQYRALLTTIGYSAVPNDLEMMRETISRKFQPIFKSQFDSISDIIRKHEVLWRDISSIITDLPSRAVGSLELDSLLMYHELLTQQLSLSRASHRRVYLEYVNSVAETGPIADLENLHTSFDDKYTIALRDFEAVKLQIADFQRKILELSDKKSNLLFISGIILFVLIITFLLIREGITRKKTHQRFTAQNAILSSRPDNTQVMDDILNAGENYYPWNAPSDIESVIKEIHFSFKAIKNLNLLVHGAVSRKESEVLGGFLFGHQYKASGEGSGTYIVVVDQVIPSKTLSSDFTPGISSNEDFVDEVDAVVSKNRKQALLGWFTSTGSDEFLMPESLIKLHRTFFREKWQIAMLIHPFVSDMTTALYLRRKTGFFEPTAPKSCLLSLEALYQYSINPPAKSSSGEEFNPNLKDYRELVLANNWCDSIVQKVYIHREVLSTLSGELEKSRNMMSSSESYGYFYGVAEHTSDDKSVNGFKLFLNRFIENSNGEAPRELPGHVLLGWLSFRDREIFETLKSAIPYHTNHFKQNYQIAVLVNTDSHELRIFGLKTNFEMNNSIIETEEFNLTQLLS